MAEGSGAIAFLDSSSRIWLGWGGRAIGALGRHVFQKKQHAVGAFLFDHLRFFLGDFGLRALAFSLVLLCYLPL